MHLCIAIHCSHAAKVFCKIRQSRLDFAFNQQKEPP